MTVHTPTAASVTPSTSNMSTLPSADNTSSRGDAVGVEEEEEEGAEGEQRLVIATMLSTKKINKIKNMRTQ